MKNLKKVNGTGRNFLNEPVLLLNQINENAMMNFKSTLELLLRVIVLVVMAFILLVGMQGCQKEEEVIIKPPEDEVMTTESPVFGMMLRTATKDGSSDNILDRSSCSSIVLPITVVIEGIEITIDSEADFLTIEKIFDETDANFDDLSFIFPITIILSDHSEIVIENAGQLEKIIDECSEIDDDDDIECVDFIYPIRVSVYDTNNQVSDVKDIHNDEELYHFLHNIKEGDLVGITFPIQLLLSDGTEIVVNDIFELKDAIEDVKDECDEDDDNDYNDDDVDDSKLIGILLEGKWYISYYLDETDQAGQYDGYLFNFFENGTVVVYNDVEEYHGKWDSSGDDGILRLELIFDLENQFASLNENWKVLEFDGELIKLYDHGDDNISEKIVKFERPEPIIELKLTDVLPEGDWIVARFDVGEDVKTELYNDFKVDFQADGSVFATNVVTIQGAWEEVIDGEVHRLHLSFGDAIPFDELSGEWNVVAIREDRVEVKRQSSVEGKIDVLVFEKLM